MSFPAKWPGFINLCTHQGCFVDLVFQIFWVQIKGFPLKFESEESATSLKSQRSLLKSGQVNHKLRFWNLIAVFTCLLTCCLNQWSITRSIYVSFGYFFIWPSATLGYRCNCFILYNHPVPFQKLGKPKSLLHVQLYAVSWACIYVLIIHCITPCSLVAKVFSQKNWYHDNFGTTRCRFFCGIKYSKSSEMILGEFKLLLSNKK